MNQTSITDNLTLNYCIRLPCLQYLKIFFAGFLLPLGFAPFHRPELAILGLAYLFAKILNSTPKRSLILGFIFGVGYFGLGVSWVIISIHDYGQLNYTLSALITLVFISYLAIYPALCVYFFKILQFKNSIFLSIILFSAMWCLSEYIRANFLTGFPWLLIGTCLIDTPLRNLAPIIGIPGLSLACAFIASLLAACIVEKSFKRYYCLVALLSIIFSPILLQNIQWTDLSTKPISVGAVQANLATRDKWDESLVKDLLTYYQVQTEKLIGKQLVILPESAIPLPPNYLNVYLSNLHEKALAANSALILGIIQPHDVDKTQFYNSILSLGYAKGVRNKHKLVPFGEYIPKPFVTINRMLNLPEPNITPGQEQQQSITIFNKPIASLICYEIAFPNLLRKQMPNSQWIVSISDNGWFGHSLASYQQLQMSQMLALLTGRYHVVVNNDGLSSVINDKGYVVVGLKAFSSGILEGEIFAGSGATPWVLWNDTPALIFCFLCIILMLSLKGFCSRNRMALILPNFVE